jgi:thermitase
MFMESGYRQYNRMRSIRIILLLTLLFGAWTGLRAETTNVLVWNTGAEKVTADIHGEALWPLLEDIGNQTGWHIFVEPGADRKADVKFKNLPRGEALKILLGDLNFAYVPQTNGPDSLYVFTTTMLNATHRVGTNAAKITKQQHVPNQLLVRLKPGANIDALARAVGAKVVGRNEKLGLYLLEFPDAATTDAALAQLKGDANVADVDYNYIFQAPPAPQPLANAPGAAPSLTLDPTTPNDPCNPVVGLIDTAVTSSGSALDQFMLKPISVVGTDGSTAATTTSGSGLTHGTAMYQTILNAISQATGGHSGVKILPVQVFDNTETATTWNVALGVQAAVDNGATVLNMSLGGGTDSPVLDSIIQQAVTDGVIIFAAAGNTPVNTPTYPAAITGVNAVTALAAPGQLASYANYGSFVDMALPGASIVYQNGEAWEVQGTSPATAYATGVAVGTKSSGCAGWTQIESALKQKYPVPQN